MDLARAAMGGGPGRRCMRTDGVGFPCGNTKKPKENTTSRQINKKQNKNKKSLRTYQQRAVNEKDHYI
jgi:hypothetical protein